jgi:hypothetical protein
MKKINQEFRQSKIYLDSLYQACLKHTRPVTAPLALISQIQRSGGTLLSQLFDGHPELHAHPHELKIGYPTKYTWPKLDLKDDPIRWLETLFEYSVLGHLMDYIGSVNSLTLRDVFDGYMTSYFGAWLNNQNSYGHKKLITAFTARLSMSKDNMESFFETYPDGRLISLMRDPKNWFPSAIRHKPRICRDIQEGVDLWRKSAQAMLWNKDKYGDRVCILTFEDLITKTKSVMRYLAEFLEIKFEDILLEPTFNKYPIRANTSFEADKNGIIDSTLNRYKTLAPDELEFIQNMTKDLYQKVWSSAVRF